MNKINILDSTIFNRIAAGEVVERPYSVLKEMLDNSLDAKATEIEINVLDGGIKQIEVSDNGVGIDYNDLERAFLPHATSKIKTIDDLEKIGTLGFRGEALASIGSVSEVELISKPKDQELGGKITVSGGKITEKQEVGFNNGTKIKMTNLFFNVPARAKFLKKSKQEASEISNIVLRYILANPYVKLKYSLDDKEIYSSSGNGLVDAIYSVYGKSTTEQILKVDFESESQIKVSGYVSMPTFTKPNRTYQTLIVNGRYVVNNMVSTCVYNAFEHYLMKGQFPFYCLNITLPLDSVDVNVHPNKMDIRFENNNQIYGIVYQAIMQSLNEHSNKVVEVKKQVYSYQDAGTTGVSFGSYDTLNGQKIELNVEKDTRFVEQTKNNALYNNEANEKPTDFDLTARVSNGNLSSENNPNINKSNNAEKIDTSIKFYENLSKSDNTLKQSTTILSNIFSKELDKINDKTNASDHYITNNDNNNFDNNTFDNSENKFDKLVENDNITNENLEKQSNIQQSFLSGDVIKFVGTLFTTYLVIEQNENCYLIDQHAAHERLLFDKLTKQVNERTLSIQSLLVPYTFSVNNLEKQFIEDNLENFKSLGFDITEFGIMHYKVSTIPSILFGMNINQFFYEILNDISVFKNLKSSDLISNKLMQHSCKTAVKAGDKLSENEILCLIKEVEDTNMQLQCPHGRPVVVKISKKEIEKWFKRVV